MVAPGPGPNVNLSLALTMDGGRGTDNAADAIRIYIKNPGSDTVLKLHYQDEDANRWEQDITVKGGSNEFAAYDFPLADMVYRYSDKGAEFALGDDGTTWAEIQTADASKIGVGQYQAFRIGFSLSEGATVYLSDMQVVTYAEEDGDKDPQGKIEILDDFNGYADAAALKKVWQNAGSSAGIDFVLGQGPDGSKAGKLTASAAGTAVYKLNFAGSDALKDAESVRIWIQGTGKVVLQFGQPVEKQPDGSSTAPFQAIFDATPEGKVHEIPLSSFTLAEWWGGAGNDTSIKLDLTKANAFYLQAIMGENTAIQVDDFAVVHKAGGSGNPDTGSAGVKTVSLLVVAVAGTGVILLRKKRS